MRKNRNAPQGSGDEKPQKRISQKIANFLDMPENAVGKVPTVELCSNTEAVLDGCGGVIEYTTEVVKVAAGNMVIKISGRGLVLKGMTTESAVVKGYITKIEYLQ